MKEKKIKVSRNLLRVMVVSIVLVIASFVVFTIVNGRAIRESNHQYLVNDTKQNAKNVSETISDGLSNIKILSELVGQSLTKPEVDIKNYQKIINDSVFDFMEFADVNGIDHNITGGESDATDRQYYQDAMLGNTGVELIMNSRATHENLLMFYSPVYYKNEMVGSLVGVYQASNRLSELLQIEYFDTPVTSYLCDSEGRVFASNQTVDATKENRIVDEIGADESAGKVLTDAIKNGKETSFLINGNRTSGYVMPLPDTDWFIVQIYPEEVNISMIRKSLSIGLYLVIFLLVVFVNMLIVVVRNNRRQSRRLLRALEESKQAKQDEKKQLTILQSMADVYYSMHLIDLTDSTYEVYQAQNQVKDVEDNNEKADAATMMYQVMHATMSDSYLDIGLAFSDVSTLEERLKNKKFISLDLQGRNVGWIRMSFITIEADEDGVPKKVICTTQIIDEEKKREERLIQQSNTDGLTACLNRRAYEETILLSPTIPEEDFVYVALDINGLKTVNDSLGHDAGDELILGAVSCMKQCFGNYGSIYRTGGDEFVAMITADEETLLRLQAKFEALQNDWSGKLVDRLSISSGYVPKREVEDISIVAMAKLADQRMYEAKARYYKEHGIERRGQKNS